LQENDLHTFFHEYDTIEKHRI